MLKVEGAFSTPASRPAPPEPVGVDPHLHGATTDALRGSGSAGRDGLRGGERKDMKQQPSRAAALALAATLLAPAAGAAQERSTAAELTGLWLTTPYPEFTLPQGETGDVPLTLRNSNLPPTRVALEVAGVPDGWEWSLKGGGKEIAAAMVGPDETEDLTLELTPIGAGRMDTFDLEVRAEHGGQTTVLPLTVSLTEAEAGGVELDPELPALRGSPRTTFSYKVEVSNDSPDDVLFNLAAEVPPGFQTSFKRGYGSDEITGVPVEAGRSETVTLEVKPAPGVPAGRYPIRFSVLGGELSAETQLSAEITGSPELRLVGPQQRLSGEAVAGEERSFTFTLQNSGSAPASGVSLSATPPSGWEVTFEPAELDAIEPGATQEVSVAIAPSERAIAGDYMVSLRASGEGVSESTQFRVTVKTATLWGIAGLGVIAAAVVVLGAAVMRYGRR